ncbi:YdcF family protein [Oceanobacillus chungangensis]|nr:YdcF family protein [Oceanobacillus chungangensis]
MIKRLSYIISIILGIQLILILGRKYLVVNEKPKKADVIIVLSGGPGRLEKGAELFKRGDADQLMLTNSNDSGTTAKEAMELGVPKDKLILEDKAISTHTNALYTLEKMREHQLTSAIIISSDFHMRRTKYIFSKVYENTGIELTFIASPYLRNSIIMEGWEVQTIFYEWIKLVGYKLRAYKVAEKD